MDEVRVWNIARTPGADSGFDEHADHDRHRRTPCPLRHERGNRHGRRRQHRARAERDDPTGCNAPVVGGRRSRARRRRYCSRRADWSCRDLRRRQRRPQLERQRRGRPRWLQRLPGHLEPGEHGRLAAQRRHSAWPPRNTTTPTGTPGTTYFYVVTAEDTSGNESGASNEVSDSPDPFSQAALQFDGTNDHVTLGSAAGSERHELHAGGLGQEDGGRRHRVYRQRRAYRSATDHQGPARSGWHDTRTRTTSSVSMRRVTSPSTSRTSGVEQ